MTDALEVRIAHLEGAYEQIDKRLGGVETTLMQLRSDLNASVQDLRSEIRSTTAELRSEIKATAAELRSEIQSTAAELRREIQSTAAELRSEIRSLRSELHGPHGQPVPLAPRHHPHHLGDRASGHSGTQRLTHT